MTDKPETKLNNTDEHTHSDDQLGSRRDFTKKGVASAAVLLTLANRPAWGTYKTFDEIDKHCISKTIMMSAVIGGASMNPTQQQDLADFDNVFRYQVNQDPWWYKVVYREEHNGEQICKILCKKKSGYYNRCDGADYPDI